MTFSWPSKRLRCSKCAGILRKRRAGFGAPPTKPKNGTATRASSPLAHAAADLTTLARRPRPQGAATARRANGTPSIPSPRFAGVPRRLRFPPKPLPSPPPPGRFRSSVSARLRRSSPSLNAKCAWAPFASRSRNRRRARGRFRSSDWTRTSHCRPGPSRRCSCWRTTSTRRRNGKPSIRRVRGRRFGR